MTNITHQLELLIILKITLLFFNFNDIQLVKKIIFYERGRVKYDILLKKKKHLLISFESATLITF